MNRAIKKNGEAALVGFCAGGRILESNDRLEQLDGTVQPIVAFCKDLREIPLWLSLRTWMG